MAGTGRQVHLSPNEGGSVILIGENINVMSERLRKAMKERDKGPIQEIARASESSGIDYLDVNIGPARKDGPALMEWIITAIREVSKLPLSLDTTNIDALKVGIEMESGNVIINSIQATEERMEQLLPLMKQYHCKCIALLIGKEGMPRDATERGALAAEFAAKVDEFGIPHGDVFFDPIVLPVAYQQDQVVNTLEFMKMFKEMLPDFSTTCGLSNVSNGVPENLRGLVNRTYLSMLMKYGLDSAIVDAFDKKLIAMAKKVDNEINMLIWNVMDNDIDIEKFTEEQKNYVKTVRILQGKSLYSHSWLKL